MNTGWVRKRAGATHLVRQDRLRCLVQSGADRSRGACEQSEELSNVVRTGRLIQGDPDIAVVEVSDVDPGALGRVSDLGTQLG